MVASVPCARERCPGHGRPSAAHCASLRLQKPPMGPFSQDQAAPTLTIRHGMLAAGRAGEAALAWPPHRTRPGPGSLLSMMLCSSVWGSWPTAWSRCCSSLLMLDTGMPKDCTNSSSCWGSRSCKAEDHTHSVSTAQGAARDPQKSSTHSMAACPAAPFLLAPGCPGVISSPQLTRSVDSLGRALHCTC